MELISEFILFIQKISLRFLYKFHIWLDQKIQSKANKKFSNSSYLIKFRYLCVDTKDFAISGNWYSDTSKAIFISFGRCDPNERDDCEDENDIDNDIVGYTMEIVMIDSYFDLHNFTQPIGSFLTEKYYYYCVPGTIKYTDIFIKENKIELTDNFMQFGGPEAKKFYSVSDVKESWAYYGGPEYVYVKLQLDPETQLYKRTVYSLLDLVGQLGGVFGILSSVCTLVIGIYSERMLFHSIVKKCYQVELENEVKYQPQEIPRPISDINGSPRTAARVAKSPFEEAKSSKGTSDDPKSGKNYINDVENYELHQRKLNDKLSSLNSTMKLRRRYTFG